MVSKAITCFVGCALMFLGFFVGAVPGGAIGRLPFDTGSAGITSVIMCMLSKLGMVAAMLLYMMVPMVTPLDSGITNVIGCFAVGGLICANLGAVSCQVLKRTSLV